MTHKLIDQGWREIEAARPFCCDDHREFFRAMYFAGAMNAMAAATDWNPESATFDPRKVVRPSPDIVQAVCAELTVEWVKSESEAEGAGHA